MIADIGSADSGWTPYTMGENNDREGAKLIVGDTRLGDAICNSTNYSNGQYLRIVLSFLDDVEPVRAREIAKEFMELFMNGYREDEYHWDMVEHSDTDFLHYHLRIPKRNLLTGTQLKLYWHKADLDRKIAIMDYLCEKHGLTNAMDRKLLVPEPSQKREQMQKWRAEHQQEPFDFSKKKVRDQAKESITDRINEMIVKGLINSLDNVKAELIEMGLEVMKSDRDIGKGFDYITVASGDKSVRLRGDIYGEHFYKHSIEDRSKAIVDNRHIEQVPEERSIEKLEERLEKENAKRFTWIENRYSGGRSRALEQRALEIKQFEAELQAVEEKTAQIASGAIKLELNPLDMGVSEDRKTLAAQTDEEENDTKKEDNDERNRTAIDSVLGRSREAERRRSERKRRRAERIALYVDVTKRTERTDYKAIEEATEQRAEQQRTHGDLKLILHSLLAGISDFGKEFFKSRKRAFDELRNELREVISEPVDVVAGAKARNAERRETNREKRRSTKPKPT